MGEEKGEINKSIILLFLFIISYAVVFAISLGRAAIAPAVAGIPVLNILLPLPAFESPMYFLLPAVGFFFIYFAIEWINSRFETKFASSPFFPLLLIIVSLLALYIAVFWLAAESARFSGQQFPQFDFWAELRGSAFYLFMLSGVLAWVSRKVIERL